MPFDFNADPLRIYGIWPQTPFPLEVSIYGYCQMACSFCFANRNRDAAGRELNPVNSAPALFRKIDRCIADPESAIGFFLREKYPICFSNTTDPFQRAEKQHRATEAFLQWSNATRTPLYIQTRGNVLWEEFDRYAPLLTPGLHVVYLSICQTDDAVRHQQEPGALSIGRRWELAARLTGRGIPVIAACNPYVVPDPGAYCAMAAFTGCKGVWLERLHFTGAQGDCLATPYRPLLFQANLAPMYLVGQLKKWYAATAANGLDFFPTPYWDAYFGHPAKHPECADPAWLGGKTLGFSFELAKLAHATMKANPGKLVTMTWGDMAGVLDWQGVPNPTLKTGDFWYPFNNQVKADRASWNARLGKTAPLWEIVRYFWNHPWENLGLIAFNCLVQPLYSVEHKDYVIDDHGDLIMIYNPKMKHGGCAYMDEAKMNWDNSVPLGSGVFTRRKDGALCQVEEADPAKVCPAAARACNKARSAKTARRGCVAP